MVSIVTIAEAGSAKQKIDWAEMPLGLDVKFAALSDDELIDAMGAVRRQISAMQAVELAGVAELASRRDAEAAAAGAVGTQVGEFVSDEVGLALTISGEAAARLIGLADDLTTRFPATWAALRAGRIDVAGARAIIEGLQHIDDDEIARTVESAVLAETPGRTSGRLRRRVRDLLVKLDPEAAARRRTTAEKGRRVELYENPSGTCDLAGRDLPADRAHAIFNKLRAAAAALKQDGDIRPIDAIRADLLLALYDGLPWPQAAQKKVARDFETARPEADCHVGPSNGACSERGPDSPRPLGGSGDVQRGGCGAAGLAADGGKPGDGSPGDAEADRATGATSTGRADAPWDLGSDAAGLEVLERLIGAVVAAAVDRQLRRVRDIGGQLGELPQLSAEALRAMNTALSPLVTRWCVATGNATDGRHGTGHYRPSPGMRRVLQRRYPVCCFPTAIGGSKTATRTTRFPITGADPHVSAICPPCVGAITG